VRVLPTLTHTRELPRTAHPSPCLQIHPSFLSHTPLFLSHTLSFAFRWDPSVSAHTIVPFKIFTNQKNLLTHHTTPSPKRSFFSFSLSILMAENLDDGEFWLPPQFLADDDVVVFPTPFEAKFPPLSDDAVLFPYGSPVDSTVGGSSETESDEEEQLVAELTRHLTRSSLQPDTESVVRYITFVFLSLLFGVGQ